MDIRERQLEGLLNLYVMGTLTCFLIAETGWRLLLGCSALL